MSERTPRCCDKPSQTVTMCYERDMVQPARAKARPRKPVRKICGLPGAWVLPHNNDCAGAGSHVHAMPCSMLSTLYVTGHTSTHLAWLRPFFNVFLSPAALDAPTPSEPAAVPLPAALTLRCRYRTCQQQQQLSSTPSPDVHTHAAVGLCVAHLCTKRHACIVITL